MKLTHLLVMALGAMTVFSGCTSSDVSEDLEKGLEQGQKHTCILRLTAEKPSYDAKESRSAEAWEYGDEIYLTFSLGTETTTGTATYNGTDWAVNYYGDLSKVATGTVKAYYFEGTKDSESSSETVIALGSQMAIYEDASGSWTMKNDTLSVVAALAPKTGRIRFQSDTESVILVNGLKSYDTYNTLTGEFSNKTVNSKYSIGTDNYTGYIYAEFWDNAKPMLYLMTFKEGGVYSREFPTTVLKAGESGYVTVPTMDAHGGWDRGWTYYVNNVQFRMLPVVSYSYIDLFGETEVTEDLYCAVMGGKPTLGMPKVGLSPVQWDTFVTKLSDMTGRFFKVPIDTDWMRAWGTYVFSSSDNIDEAGWYSGNSNGKLHPVKLKAPNQYGLYDMCGNASEYTIYSSSTNYFKGGDYSRSADGCIKGSYYTSSSSTNLPYIGLRLYIGTFQR